MKHLIILLDEDNNFLISLKNLKVYQTMNVDLLNENFAQRGYKVEVLRFCELDLSTDFAGKYIIYQTSEAEGSFYKRYIEDVVFYLERNGAIVLPKYEYLKAHHNKGYMELLKNTFNDQTLKTIKTKYYGSSMIPFRQLTELPFVIKQISGSGSDGVYLVRNEKEYREALTRVSNTVIGNNVSQIIINRIKNQIKQLVKLVNKKYTRRIPPPIYRPFIVQTFIKGLGGDYKVLYFGGKYYTLYRKNRENDFRASGGGRLFVVPENEQEALLHFARRLVGEIDFPIIGMDIGFDGNRFHLIEFQMIHLGPYTLQASDFWHEFIDNNWVRFDGKSNLEEEFSRSIFNYIESIGV